MSKTVMLRVRDRKTGVERTVTHKAYAAMGPKVYEKLGPAEATESESVQKTGPVQTVHRSVSAPVVRKQIPAIEEEQDPEPESDTDETVEAKPERKKPGRKAKSISSNSTADEK